MWHLHKQSHSIKKPTAGQTSSSSLSIHLTVQFPAQGFNLEHRPLTVSGILIFTRSATHTQGKKGPCADTHLQGYSFIILTSLLLLYPSCSCKPSAEQSRSIHPSIHPISLHPYSTFKTNGALQGKNVTQEYKEHRQGFLQITVKLHRNVSSWK